MARFLLRIESVNFAWSCYDTEDLSTIRGGSMLMMHAHELIKAPDNAKLEVHGASQSIWSFNADNLDAANVQRQVFETALSGHPQLQHATFVVDVVPATDDGPNDIRSMRVANRWRQYQQPTLVVPQSGEKSYCEFDYVRPASTTVKKGDEERPASESVKTRRKFGRDEKRAFYSKRVPESAAWNLAFAHDLEQITSRKDIGEGDPLKRLHGKMAVIYLDGNKQSEMAAGMGLSCLAKFRNDVRNHQDRFLADLLTRIKNETPTDKSSNDWHIYLDGQARVRLETLLWGGDDILMVVPAWKGWEVVSLFFDHVTQKRQEAEPIFTYAGGLVLCSHKASIRRMRNLAEDLFKQGKMERDADGNYQNLLGYEVLESYDVAGDDLRRWRAARLCNDVLESDSLLLRPEQLAPVAEMVRAVKRAVDNEDSKVSRRKIERAARDMHTKVSTDAKFDKQAVGPLATVPKFADLAGLENRQKLHHLAALWDYIQ